MDVSLMPRTSVSVALPKWKQVLAEWGVLREALAAGWRPKGNGWSYPVFSRYGNPVVTTAYTLIRRWMRFTSTAHFKYRWETSDLDRGQRPSLYALPGTVQAIIKNGGYALLVGNELEVLTCQAAGMRNVVGLFGGQKRPPCLPDELNALGVAYVECAPNLDDAHGNKFSVNQLWQDCGFIKAAFWEAIRSFLCTGWDEP